MSFTKGQSQFSEILCVLFVCLFLKQTKIILMPERCILGWYILLALTWVYPNLLMHSSIEGHSDFFKFLAIMSRAAVHNCILVCILT